MTPVTALSHRRALVCGGLAGLLTAAMAAAAVAPGDPGGAFAALEREMGGRLGVAALDTGTGRWIGHRADERFAMASSFKVLLAGAILAAIDRGVLAPDRMVRYSRADLLSHAPRTAERVGVGAMSVLELCAAAIEVSDNTAANLLLGLTGGPPGLTSWLRGIGDPVTRLDRTEPTLNTNLAGDERDTTTPRAYVRALDRILLGEVLSAEGRGRLIGWMIACETGRARLRAGLPRGWRVGDKTGAGENGAVNDVAIAWPPGRAPILIAVLMAGSSRSVDDLSTAHARVGAITASAFD